MTMGWEPLCAGKDRAVEVDPGDIGSGEISVGQIGTREIGVA